MTFTRIAVLVTTASGVNLDCRYEMCMMNRRNSYTGFGCHARCTFGIERTLVSASCDRLYLESVWDRLIGISGGIKKPLLLIGARYYAEGYMARGVAAHMIAENRSLYENKELRFSGTLRCWRKGNLSDTGGLIIFNGGSKGSYNFSVLRMETVCNSTVGEHSRYKWLVINNSDTKTYRFLNDTSGFDFSFLCQVCPLLLRRMNRQMILNVNSNLDTKDLCKDDRLDQHWWATWRNWTKYSELSADGTEPQFIDPVSRVKQFSKGMDPRMLGIVAVGGGGLMLIVMFCFMTVKRRHDIARDFGRRRSRSSSFRL